MPVYSDLKGPDKSGVGRKCEPEDPSFRSATSGMTSVWRALVGAGKGRYAASGKENSIKVNENFPDLSNLVRSEQFPYNFF